MLRVGVFIAASAGVFALLAAVARFRARRSGDAGARIAAEFGDTRDAGPSTLYRNLTALDLAGTKADAVPALMRIWRRWGTGLDDLLRQADIPLTNLQFVGVTFACGAAFGFAAFMLWGRAPALFAFVVACAVPPVVARMKRSIRRERFLRGLGGAFELMGRVLRAGRTVPQAFQAVSETHEGPLAVAFANCQQQMDLGLRPEEALKELADRSGMLELRVLVVALNIQRQTGGNLSDVLDRLALLVRSRLRLRQQIRALTAEGRLQSLTLVALPFITFGVMFFVNRQYTEVLLDHRRLLLATAALMVVGVLWIRRIVNLEA